MNSSTMMNRIDASWIWLPCLLDCCWFATLVATCPARCTWRSGGKFALFSAPWRSSMSVLSRPWSNGEMLEVTRSCTARRLGETPRKCVPWGSTVGTLASSVTARWSAAWSAAVSSGAVVTATTGIWLWLTLPISGCASVAASLLGAEAGRKAPLLLSTWLERLGSVRRREDRAHDPHQHDQPAEPDREPSDADEDAAHCRPPCLWVLAPGRTGVLGIRRRCRGNGSGRRLVRGSRAPSRGSTPTSAHRRPPLPHRQSGVRVPLRSRVRCRRRLGRRTSVGPPPSATPRPRRRHALADRHGRCRRRGS